jgi:4a-hydroxytetrahydrobiopterin dehydratase
MARELLGDDAVDDALAGTSWKREGGEITTTYTLADFKQAMALVNRVADMAEERNHHPDIAISWNKVTLRLSTHDSGGLTALDVELARAIEALDR